jgi:hypothetical protein
MAIKHALIRNHVFGTITSIEFFDTNKEAQDEFDRLELDSDIAKIRKCKQVETKSGNLKFSFE